MRKVCPECSKDDMAEASGREHLCFCYRCKKIFVGEEEAAQSAEQQNGGRDDD